MRPHAFVSFFATSLAAAATRAAEPVALPNLPPAQTWIATSGGQIRVLDKQKAQSHLLALKSGQTATFESLSLTLLACVVHPPSVAGDAAGFLQITDSREGEPGFRGWMLSHQPGLATLQSPVYGVRVVGCEKPTQVAIDAAVPPEPPPADAPPITGPSVVTPSTAPADLAPPPGQDLNAPPDQPGVQ